MALLVSASPAVAQQESPGDRAQVFALMRTGGPVVSAGAEVALVASDAEVRDFLNTALPAAQEADDRIAAQRLLADGGPATRDAVNAALSGSIGDVRAFLVSG
ncbi:ALF repeat-containing protein [Actinosynnema pretiosum subsp. pretiosum]|uniref:ALF repeat-containing protein n=1 Tax=Actinosynnema pretiosum subsp. pretiosum TaxID=103721 RepID=A0AA45R4K2_9PSEU|nr:ALF repeat-containing protein [Actinosynnema pretiosum subsp. pretiosum]